MKTPQADPENEKTWTRTNVQNLMRHKSGRYYARIYSGGKETWRALKTDLLEVAKAKLRDQAGEIVKSSKAKAAHDRGRMTIGDCAAMLRERLAQGLSMPGRTGKIRKLRPNSISYRERCIQTLFRSWPELEKTDVRKVSKRDVEAWSGRFSSAYSPTVYNNTLDTLREFFRIAESAGAVHGNAASEVARATVLQKTLVLPTRPQFLAFVESIRENRAWCSRDCADLVEFLAFTGARKDEAANVLWSDVDFPRGRIHIREGKGGHSRHVPMIREAEALLTRLRSERPDERGAARVLRVGEAQHAMDAAAGKVGFKRITHHDLRHLFATTAIEAGIDIPTVSRWLGHKDGGALAMKTYGHLRDDHSMQSAKRVSFS